MGTELASILLGLMPAAHGQEDAASGAGQPPALILRQSGEADVTGDDDLALRAALERLRPTGGTLVLGAGRYAIRRQLYLSAGITLRGEPGAVLALPAPTRTRTEAAAGTRTLRIEDAHDFRGDTRVQLLPPVGSTFFPDGTTERIELVRIESVAGDELTLAEALQVPIPAGSRVGYPHKLLWVVKEGGVTIEDLAFEGGRDPEIPMPGHSQRCAIWAAAPFGYKEERLSAPGANVIVRHCHFKDWYGRGVALYNQVDGAVESCLFERIDDEAIDLDHFVERYRIVGNEVRDAVWGIVLNDASHNLVEFNHVDGGRIGIFSWRYELTPGEDLNVENVIRGNFVRGTSEAAIDVGTTCVRYVIEHNFVQGEIRVAESENRVGPNTRLP